MDTFFNSDDISHYDDVFTSDDQRDCSIFGCSNIRSQNDNFIKYIGDDSDNNKIFKHQNKLFKESGDIIPHDTNIKYLDESILVPMHNNTIKIKFTLNDYNYVGIAANKFYHLEFLVYAKQFDKDSTLEQVLFEYIFVKIIDNEYKIYYQLPPRTKINKLESIWISYGNYQLGPLTFY
jgi:hypothetical protein